MSRSRIAVIGAAAAAVLLLRFGFAEGLAGVKLAGGLQTLAFAARRRV